jgi:hypothetical protein
MMNTQISPEEYLKNRVQDQIDWYDRKSGILKKRYRRMKAATILLGISIPVVVSLSNMADGLKYVAGGLGAIISGLEGISGMLKDKDNYLAYRATREALMREKMLFTAAAGPYEKAQQAFARFVANCEGIMAHEHAGWFQTFQEENKSSKTA